MISLSEDKEAKMNQCFTATTRARVLAIVVSVTFVGGVIPAQSFAQTIAADIKAAEQIASEARIAFTARHFDVAAAKYFEAYSLSKKATMLFNAARAKQEARKFVDARELYRIYVTLPKINSEGIKDANARIAECDAEMPKIESAKVSLPPIVRLTEDVASPHQDATQTTVDDVPVTTNYTFEPNKLISWQSGVAIGLVAVGVGLMAHGSSRTTQANTLPLLTDADRNVYQGEFRTARIEWYSGLVLEVLGAGMAYLAVTRAVTFDKSPVRRTASLIPTLNNEGIGLALVGSF